MRTLPLPLVVTLTLLGLAVLFAGLIRAGVAWRRRRDLDFGLIYVAGALMLFPWLVEHIATW